ncbi:MAG: putative monofunctional peptidoglycan glycosyltransferase, Glycosyltransferase Family 51 [Ramlibacter sp.]|jgi:monofunctional biosynthetic peptidoglycan transglycosylase|nr:putative monofunctional peptidoglycan glycosyltransferase, Glycosyltransferase Family 51 [Ramlibacter sp.]MCE3273912.1 putative monofunctional peptidoglycan glycosyltransferase, Glycosyltransferase Family 51 [Ramlibacter sp.]
MKALARWVALLLFAFIALQLFFVGRIAAMVVIDPESTTFQRSEAYRIARDKDKLRWRQRWVPYSQISDHLKRAVIASEDGSFANHEGVDWDAVEKAWERNTKAQEMAAKRAMLAPKRAKPARIIGGSTITQQLAKNLLLSGERNLLRKGQELALTMVLEQTLSKQRILEIYLNNVEWGEGVFGAEAAAQHYFRKSASRLTAYEAARLAVMLPQPKRFEKTPGSGYLASRASTIVARMRDAELP